jgi:hypothetical protein
MTEAIEPIALNYACNLKKEYILDMFDDHKTREKSM